MEPSTIEISLAAIRTAAAEQDADEAAADDDLSAQAFRDKAVYLVLGDDWAYEDLVNMPSWKSMVDHVAQALLAERRAGFLQARSGD